jgi:hypothetical protein
VKFIAEPGRCQVLTVTELRASLPDGLELVGGSLFLGELRDPIFQATDGGIAHVMTERLSHELRAGAVLGLADALELGRHLGRQRNRECGRGAGHIDRET